MRGKKNPSPLPPPATPYFRNMKKDGDTGRASHHTESLLQELRPSAKLFAWLYPMGNTTSKFKCWVFVSLISFLYWNYIGYYQVDCQKQLDWPTRRNKFVSWPRIYSYMQLSLFRRQYCLRYTMAFSIVWLGSLSWSHARQLEKHWLGKNLCIRIMQKPTLRWGLMSRKLLRRWVLKTHLRG